jgi:hypothetical protein
LPPNKGKENKLLTCNRFVVKCFSPSYIKEKGCNNCQQQNTTTTNNNNSNGSNNKKDFVCLSLSVIGSSMANLLAVVAFSRQSIFAVVAFSQEFMYSCSVLVAVVSYHFRLHFDAFFVVHLIVIIVFPFPTFTW